MGSGSQRNSGIFTGTGYSLEDMVMPMINIENLKYKYPDTDRLALDGISLSVAPGEFIGIVGPNGAGKSTLCQAMVG